MKTPNNVEGVSRREFLRRSAVLAAGATLAGGLTGRAVAASKKNRGLPSPNKSGIEHIVMAMMENRSFDHLLGWLLGADGRQAGLTYVDAAGVAQLTAPLAPDFQGCGHLDPDHSFAGARIEFNAGGCDGWLRARLNDASAIGYYTQADYQHAAQTGRLDNSIFPLCLLPTIWDRLADHSISRKYCGLVCRTALPLSQIYEALTASPNWANISVRPASRWRPVPMAAWVRSRRRRWRWS